jgi:hypothetical protein
VAEADATAPRGRAAGKLRERDAELGELRAALHRAAGGNGGAVVVEGAAGTGKTALVRTLAREAAASGLLVLTARGSDIERAFAFGVVRQLFERVVGLASARERRALLAGAAAPAGRLVGPEAPAAAAAAAPGGAGRPAVYWLARHRASC